MRTSVNFKDHVHRIEIFKSNDNEIRVDHFQVGDSMTNYIQFINTNDVMTVTGDFGNWVFCRPFIPSKNAKVSDHYWMEKLRMLSEQKLTELDLESISDEIKDLINTGLEEYGYEGDQLIECKEWYQELLDETDDDLSYLNKAYRDDEKPDYVEYEDIPIFYKVPVWLDIIFDAYEEICSRL